MRARLGGRSVLIKLDSMCPSGSFKDRGTILLVAHALDVSAREIVIDSSGNAASSIAMYAARAGLPCRVFVPANASAGKLVQAKAMGAQVIAVAGDRGAAGTAAEQACSTSSYYANHNWSPLFPEGVMTWYLEVLEQLSSPPPQVFLPTSGGSVVTATGIAMSIAGTRTAVHAVQPAVCAPLLADYLGQPAPSTQLSVAEGANIADPPRRAAVLEIVRVSGGSVRGVSESQISHAAQELWSQGIYVEPTGALGAAGFIAAVQEGLEVPEDSVVLVTGHGLKTTPTNEALLGARR
ncbi:MAG: pyridoxal-phosphate dependent enzyme [Actinomycetota bacterium]|nr:pyridoxal-phosphate dependent enzyme [Actinomycetota bacterium]MDQ2956877.1 pyridoxal-phosphate dependent enzyme [Actinomycetota bacterium]